MTLEKTDDANESGAVPWTLPSNANGLEIMRAVDEITDEGDIVSHVALFNVIGDGFTWGVYRADIARIIVRDYGDLFEADEGCDLLTSIRRGFIKAFEENLGAFCLPHAPGGNEEDKTE